MLLTVLILMSDSLDVLLLLRGDVNDGLYCSFDVTVDGKFLLQHVSNLTFTETYFPATTQRFFSLPQHIDNFSWLHGRTNCSFRVFCGMYSFLFVIRCNAFVCEQSNSWHDSLLTYIITIGCCLWSLLWTINAVVRRYSTPKPFCLTLFWFHIQVYWWVCFTSEFNQASNET